MSGSPLAPLAALACSALFGAAYRAWSGTTVAPAEVLFLCLGAGLAALLGGMIVVWLRDGVTGLRTARMMRNLLALAVLAAFGMLLSFWVQDVVPGAEGRKLALQVAAVAALAGLVGFGEVVSRYRDDPARLIAADGAVIYVVVNVAAGVSALMLVQEFEVFKGDPHQKVKEVLLGGFGAIAFFRTSLFTVRVGGSDVGIGPSAVLKSLLDASELMIDRWQAGNRGDEAGLIMQPVSFAKAHKALPVMCFSMIQQAVSDEQQTAIRRQIDELAADRTIPDDAKPALLGVYLVRLVGADVLRKAVATLGASIRT